MRLTRRAVLAGSAAGLALPLSARAAPITIGIAQWGTHSQLDEAVDSFRQRLTQLGRVDGRDITYVEENAHFQTSLLPQIIARLRADSPVLLLTISTPVSQAAKQVMKGSGIPIVFAAVTDPVLAKLTPSWQQGAEDMTGASNLEDIDQDLAFFRQLFPDAKRIGFPFNPGEDNNVSVANRLKEAAPKAGFTVTEVAVNSPNDVALRIASLKGQVDFLYTPAGGMIQPAIPAISATAAQIGLPLVDSGTAYVKQNIALAGFAVDYAKVGTNAADIANRILSGTKPADIAPVPPGPNDYQKAVSAVQLKKFGMTLPAALKDCGCVVS
jgi:putative tryptophan/tyrosine transport system substrate-binding protein